MIHLILASSSPRRRELLGWLDLPFEIARAEIDERPAWDESPQDMVLRLSRAKAGAAAQGYPAGIVIAADTIVVHAGEILGKPRHGEDAVAILRRLRGEPHQVFSGITLLDAATRREVNAVCETTVHMRDYSDGEIARYVASGDPLDKAGAYAIQDTGFCPVARLEGCYLNVMGLPLGAVWRGLKVLAVDVPAPTRLAAECARHSGQRCCVATPMGNLKSAKSIDTRNIFDV